MAYRDSQSSRVGLRLSCRLAPSDETRLHVRPSLGFGRHKMRSKLETALASEDRRRASVSLSAAGCERNVVAYARTI